MAKSREIPTKFDLIAFQGHPRSSISVSIETQGATILVIDSNFSCICYRFRDIDV